MSTKRVKIIVSDNNKKIIQDLKNQIIQAENIKNKIAEKMQVIISAIINQSDKPEAEYEFDENFDLISKEKNITSTTKL